MDERRALQAYRPNERRHVREENPGVWAALASGRCKNSPREAEKGGCKLQQR